MVTLGSLKHPAFVLSQASHGHRLFLAPTAVYIMHISIWVDLTGVPMMLLERLPSLRNVFSSKAKQ